jgi:DNA-binding transcriptional MerR regulator
MRVASRLYSAREMADFAHCSLLLLEYLCEIDLLVPQHRLDAGLHRYDDVNLLRLQQIRIGRARGLALEEIRRWLDAGAHDVGSPGLPPRRPFPHEPLYLETEAKVETPADREAFLNEANRLYVALAASRRAGDPPEDPVLVPWVERHRCHINRWFYPCDARQHVAFGRAMAGHPLHGASIERHGSALAGFMLRVLAAQRETGA